MDNLKSSKKEVFLYLLFGGLSFVISVLSYAYFNAVIGLNELVANIISWVLAVTFSYLTNRIWVFDSPTKTCVEFLKQMGSFFAGRIITLILEEIILFIFISWIGLNSLAVKIVAQVIVIVSNYIISKLVVFKK